MSKSDLPTFIPAKCSPIVIEHSNMVNHTVYVWESYTVICNPGYVVSTPTAQCVFNSGVTEPPVWKLPLPTCRG